jgi:hypothetical protein
MVKQMEGFGNSRRAFYRIYPFLLAKTDANPVMAIIAGSIEARG